MLSVAQSLTVGFTYALVLGALPQSSRAQTWPPGTTFETDCTPVPFPLAGTGIDNRYYDTLTADGLDQVTLTSSQNCYGDGAWTPAVVQWSEKTYGSNVGNTVFVRRFSYFRPPNTAGVNLPLIIYSHPNGAKEGLGDLDLYRKLAVAAVSHGFALMSVQFRHPTASQDRYPIPTAPQSGDGASPPPADAKPSSDIATAIQFARERAKVLQIDSDNIFLVGQSRGSLAVLTGLMADRKKAVRGANDPSYITFSSKPKAVFAAQAQVAYDQQELKTTFMKPLASVAVSQQIRDGSGPLQYPSCDNFNGTIQFSYHCHYDKSIQKINNIIPNNPLSALAALKDPTLNINGVPIWLRYERSPRLSGGVPVFVGLTINKAGEDQTNINIDTNYNCYEPTSVSCIDVHHPNYGWALVDAYRQRALSLALQGSKTYVFAQYGAGPYGPGPDKAAQRDAIGGQFYQNYYCFFMGYKTAGDAPPVLILSDAGNASRVLGVNGYNSQFLPDDSRRVDPGKCLLSETSVWPS
jgi:hypothetical protein